MNTIHLKSIVVGIALGICGVIAVAVGTGAKPLHDRDDGRFALFSHTWRAMEETTLNSSYHPLGLFRIDQHDGRVWALASETDRRGSVAGWIPVGKAPVQTTE